MQYEDCLTTADKAGLTVKEVDMVAHDGLIVGNRVAIRRGIETFKKRFVTALSKLSEREWEVLEHMALEITEGRDEAPPQKKTPGDND